MLVSDKTTVSLPHSRHTERFFLGTESNQIHPQLILERPMEPRRVKPRGLRQPLRD